MLQPSELSKKLELRFLGFQEILTLVRCTKSKKVANEQWENSTYKGNPQTLFISLPI
jgi:hypothetical protein